MHRRVKVGSNRQRVGRKTSQIMTWFIRKNANGFTHSKLRIFKNENICVILVSSSANKSTTDESLLLFLKRWKVNTSLADNNVATSLTHCDVTWRRLIYFLVSVFVINSVLDAVVVWVLNLKTEYVIWGLIFFFLCYLSHDWTEFNLTGVWISTDFQLSLDWMSAIWFTAGICLHFVQLLVVQVRKIWFEFDLGLIPVHSQFAMNSTWLKFELNLTFSLLVLLTQNAAS